MTLSYTGMCYISTPEKNSSRRHVSLLRTSESAGLYITTSKLRVEKRIQQNKDPPRPHAPPATCRQETVWGDHYVLCRKRGHGNFIVKNEVKRKHNTGASWKENHLKDNATRLVA